MNGHIDIFGVAAVGIDGDVADDGGADIPDDATEAKSVSGVFDDKGIAGGGVLDEIFTGRTDCGVCVLDNGLSGTIKLFPDSIEGRTLLLVEFSGSKYEFKFFTGNTFGGS